MPPRHRTPPQRAYIFCPERKQAILLGRALPSGLNTEHNYFVERVDEEGQYPHTQAVVIDHSRAGYSPQAGIGLAQQIRSGAWERQGIPADVPIVLIRPSLAKEYTPLPDSRLEWQNTVRLGDTMHEKISEQMERQERAGGAEMLLVNGFVPSEHYKRDAVHVRVAELPEGAPVVVMGMQEITALATEKTRVNSHDVFKINPVTSDFLTKRHMGAAFEKARELAGKSESLASGVQVGR